MSTWKPLRPDPESPERREAVATLARATVAAIVAASLPRIPAAAAAPRAASESDWTAWAQAAQSAVAAGVDKWTAGSTVHGGEINGSSLFLPPGSLDGPAFAATVEQAVAGAGALPQIAAGLAQATWQPWATWSRDYTLSVPRAVRAFAAVAASEVGPTPLGARSLRSGSAPGRVGLTAAVLPQIFAQVVPGANDPAAAAPLQALANWYASAFTKWFNRAKLQNLVMGKGPIPTFAPPYVPVGPVVGGAVDGIAVILATSFS
jgi:hypothetical protein